MAENIERATPAQLQELMVELVERVETVDRRVTRVVWTPAARPFFAAGEVVADDSGALLWRPQGVLRAREQRSEDDPLAWYAEAAGRTGDSCLARDGLTRVTVAPRVSTNTVQTLDPRREERRTQA